MFQSPAFALGLILLPTMSSAATVVSHWTMNNPSPYTNEVSGGPAMVYDTTTKAPATFDGNETRLETSFDATKSTRISATDPSLTLNTFSFSMIVDPTDIINFGTIIQKESGAANSFAGFQRIGWQVIHTESGNLEFVVRGTDPGTKDFYGALSVTGAASGFTAGASFDEPATYYQIAGGYNASTGAAFLYVTALGSFPVSSLTGNTATFDSGAFQDASALSVGTAKSGSDYIGNGTGYDLADLQIYDGVLSESELLFLANNPGQSIPEPAAAVLVGLGLLGLLRRRRD